MDSKEIKRLMQEALQENGYRPQYGKPKKKKVEFSKKLILGASIFVGLFCIVSVASWFIIGDWPREIAEFFIWPFIGIASYNAKTAFENRAKIQKGWEE